MAKKGDSVRKGVKGILRRLYSPEIICFRRLTYLFLESGEGREKERERNIATRACAPTGIKKATFQVAGWQPAH